MAEACSTKRTRNGQFHPDGIRIRGKGDKRGNILTRLKYRIDELKHFYQLAIDKLIESNKYRERHLMVFISILGPRIECAGFSTGERSICLLSSPHTGHPCDIRSELAGFYCMHRYAEMRGNFRNTVNASTCVNREKLFEISSCEV